jgi:aconitate hydratase
MPRSQKAEPAEKVEPLVPVDLVVDHSVQVDFAGSQAALDRNMQIEFIRNRERYEFLKWGQQAFETFSVVPPGIGIVHQVNLEYLAKGVLSKDGVYYPDTLVGTDSHTTMINGLGVVGWGVGGIEAEAGMLGQPVTFLVPEVVGVYLHGELAEGVTATDLTLRVTEMLRAHGVVGKFVEFHGPGAVALSLPDRATIANMAPEYGATMGFFPVDGETIDYLRGTGRPEELCQTVENYFKAQGLFGIPDKGDCEYTDLLELDLATIVPAVAGPEAPAGPHRRPGPRRQVQPALHHPRRRRRLRGNGEQARRDGPAPPRLSRRRVRQPAHRGRDDHRARRRHPAPPRLGPHRRDHLLHQHLQPERHARRRPGRQEGERKTPHRRAIRQDLARPGLARRHRLPRGHRPAEGTRPARLRDRRLRLHHLHRQLRPAPPGDRGCDQGRRPRLRLGALRQPQLRGPRPRLDPRQLPHVPAAGRRLRARRPRRPRPDDRAARQRPDGNPVFLKDLWPTQAEIREQLDAALKPDVYAKLYGNVDTANPKWGEINGSTGASYKWDEKSTYVQSPPFFDSKEGASEDVIGARPLGIFGDSVTTDHISPAGAIKPDLPRRPVPDRGNGVEKASFNSFGSRRGNDRVMTRGTFGNVRIKNLMCPGIEGGYTQYLRQLGCLRARRRNRRRSAPSRPSFTTPAWPTSRKALRSS